jgi:hypothetical protein
MVPQGGASDALMDSPNTSQHPVRLKRRESPHGQLSIYRRSYLKLAERALISASHGRLRYMQHHQEYYKASHYHLHQYYNPRQAFSGSRNIRLLSSSNVRTTCTHHVRYPALASPREATTMSNEILRRIILTFSLLRGLLDPGRTK